MAAELLLVEDDMAMGMTGHPFRAGTAGLGWAIVRRVAQLHGGRLLPEPGPVTSLALALPTP